MTYLWTDEQINAAIKKGKKASQKDWLGTDVFRVGKVRDDQNKKAEASDIRKLMAMLVKRNLAFDNGADTSSKEYKVSFNWDSKGRLLRKTEIASFFSPYLLSSLERLQLPSDNSLIVGWDRPKHYSCLLKTRIKWDVILGILRVLDETGKLGLDPSIDKYLDKQAKVMALSMAKQVACMYKAFEIGWDDIKAHYPVFRDHNLLFIYALREQSHADFQDCLNPPEIKLYADKKRLDSMITILNFVAALTIKEMSGRLPNNMRELLAKNTLFQDVLDKALKDSKALYNRSPWQKEHAERLLFILGILLKSSNPEARNAAWDFIKANIGLVSGIQRLIRREIDSRTKANKADK